MKGNEISFKKFNKKEVSVFVKDGEVTLEGTVSSDEVKERDNEQYF